MGSSMVCGVSCEDVRSSSAFLSSYLLLADRRSLSAVMEVRVVFPSMIERLTCSLPALPFSGWLYRMNSFTGTPVNTVWFVAFWSIAVGLLAFAGESAATAVFSLSVTALYVAYAIPIAARFMGDNDFEPGPFNLGVFVRFSA